MLGPDLFNRDIRCTRQRPIAKSSSNAKDNTITPPYPWVTDRRATVHTLEFLRSKGIKKISGEVQCKRCNAQLVHEFDLEEKFKEVADYIIQNKEAMHERAPARWMKPHLLACNRCGDVNSAKPVMESSAGEINWLFLLLGQMLGLCTLAQLKYFCEHTKNHRTGAKDRLLFLTFLGLCKQLDPLGPFDR